MEEEPALKWRGNLIITWVDGGFSLTPNMIWGGPWLDRLIKAHAVTPQSGQVAPKTDSAAQQLAKEHGYTALPFNSVPSYFLFGAERGV